MIDFAALLKARPNGVLATADGNKIKTRVFQYLFSETDTGGKEGKYRVYFCTDSEKKVYAQMRKNSHVSFCTFPENFSPVLSVNGKAVFVEDVALKTRALDENPMIKDVFKGPENPKFRLFCIEVQEFVTYSPAEGPKTYKV